VNWIRFCIPASLLKLSNSDEVAAVAGTQEFYASLSNG
jgi:hypothetical protein